MKRLVCTTSLIAVIIAAVAGLLAAPATTAGAHPPVIIHKTETVHKELSRNGTGCEIGAWNGVTYVPAECPRPIPVYKLVRFRVSAFWPSTVMLSGVINAGVRVGGPIDMKVSLWVDEKRVKTSEVEVRGAKLKPITISRLYRLPKARHAVELTIQPLSEPSGLEGIRLGDSTLSASTG